MHCGAQAWRASDCMAGLDWSSLRCYSSSGEASASDDYHWLSALAGYKPVIEYCGGALCPNACNDPYQRRVSANSTS